MSFGQVWTISSSSGSFAGQIICHDGTASQREQTVLLLDSSAVPSLRPDRH
uniref:Uncharacterized protein n=1 Tax=Anguilla anguilla TaxID=7936 RepID=A0A0E9TFZ7_ANGAN